MKEMCVLKEVGESESKFESARHHDEELMWQVMDIRSRDIWELELKLIQGVVRCGSGGGKAETSNNRKQLCERPAFRGGKKVRIVP
jgi:hypothetical protein